MCADIDIIDVHFITNYLKISNFFFFFQENGNSTNRAISSSDNQICILTEKGFKSVYINTYTLVDLHF